MPTTYPEIYFPVLVQVLIAMARGGRADPGAPRCWASARAVPLKDTPYESGMAPVGSARERFSVKFYLVGMIFILFDIEAVFLYPWAVVYRELKMFGFVEMLIFVALVLVGFFYVWKKGALDWGPETKRTGAKMSERMNHPAILETKRSARRDHADRGSRADRGSVPASQGQREVRPPEPITAVDWHPAEPRFEVVYHLHSIERESAAAAEVPRERRESGDRFGHRRVARGRTGMSAKCSTCSASASAIIRTWCAS